MNEYELKVICILSNKMLNKEVCALRGYFGPPRRLTNKNCFSAFSSHWFIRAIAQVYISGIKLTFTVAMVTRKATKIG